MTRWMALGAVVLVLAGCSGEQDESAEPTDVATSSSSEPSVSSTPNPSAPPASESSSADLDADLEAAVTDYSDAFLTGDGEAAFALLTQRCRERIGEQQFDAIVDQAGELYGSALPIETYDAEVNGEQARVSYTYSLSALDQDQEPWAVEAGGWRNDDC